MLNAAAVQAPPPGPNVPELTQDRDEERAELTDCFTNLTAALLVTDISQIPILKMTITRLYNKYVKAPAELQPFVPQSDKIATKRVENTNANTYETLKAGIQAFEETHKKNLDSINASSVPPKAVYKSFSGEPTEWTNWWEMFSKGVHLKAMDIHDKFTLLQNLTTGTAHKVVNGYKCSVANYHKAVDELRSRFGRPELVLEAHIQALMALPATKNSAGSLRNLLNTIEYHSRCVEALGETPDAYANAARAQMVKILPTELTTLWRRNHTGGILTFNQLMGELTTEVQALEQEEMTRKQVKESAQMQSLYVNTGGKGKQTRIKRCSCLCVNTTRSLNHAPLVTT